MFMVGLWQWGESYGYEYFIEKRHGKNEHQTQ